MPSLPFPRAMSYVETHTALLPTYACAQLAVADQDTYDNAYRAATHGYSQVAGTPLPEGIAGWDGRLNAAIAAGNVPYLDAYWTLLHVELAGVARGRIALAEHALWMDTHMVHLGADHDLPTILRGPLRGYGTAEGLRYSFNVDGALRSVGVSEHPQAHHCPEPLTRVTGPDTYTIGETFTGTGTDWQRLAYHLVWGIRQRVAADTCAGNHSEFEPCWLCNVNPTPYVEQPRWDTPPLPTDNPAQRAADRVAATAAGRRRRQ